MVEVRRRRAGVLVVERRGAGVGETERVGGVGGTAVLVEGGTWMGQKLGRERGRRGQGQGWEKRVAMAVAGSTCTG